jgi:hypothetical protein
MRSITPIIEEPRQLSIDEIGLDPASYASQALFYDVVGGPVDSSLFNGYSWNIPCDANGNFFSTYDPNFGYPISAPAPPHASPRQQYGHVSTGGPDVIISGSDVSHSDSFEPTLTGFKSISKSNTRSASDTPSGTTGTSNPTPLNPVDDTF